MTTHIRDVVIAGAHGDGSHAIDDTDTDGSLRRKWNAVFLRDPSSSYSLLPSQAAALESLSLVAPYEGVGGFIAKAVGSGKTLLAMLVRALYPDVKNPLFLTQPSLMDEYEGEIAKWRPYFKVFAPTGVTYSILSRPEATGMLRDMAPDLIIADEVQALSNKKSARGDRFWRYMRENPHVRFIAMTGTIDDKSISEYTHILRRALGPLNWLPHAKSEMNRWRSVLDTKGEPSTQDVYAFRPLVEFYGKRWPGAMTEQRDAARKAYAQRLATTPGVLMTSQSSSQAPLHIHIVTDPVPSALEEEIDKVRRSWTLPCGDEIVDGAEMARHRRTLAVGFYNRWDWDAVDADSEWNEARLEWSKQVRAYLSAWSREGCDSPALVERWVTQEQPRNGLTPALARWSAVRDLTPPPTVPVWVNYEVLHHGVQWLLSGDPKKILWYYSPAVGDMLEKFGVVVKRALPKPTARTCPRVALPFTKFHTGQNLQDYTQHRLIQPRAGGKPMEQWLGRGHRGGTQGDVHVYLDGRTPMQIATIEESATRTWGSMARGRQTYKMFGDFAHWHNPTTHISELLRRAKA